MVVVVPEHGAALAGDRMQMSGLRDIPSPAITRMPVGIRLYRHPGSPCPDPPYPGSPAVTWPSPNWSPKRWWSDLRSATIDWNGLFNNLPEDPMVSENQGTVVVHYQGLPHQTGTGRLGSLSPLTERMTLMNRQS
ncbi:cellulose biosynthesis protein BcsG [Aeromonas sp. A-5]|uniref:cellulose biosynthesis protein BcsG n=1 Tax=Aeromonas ichthyocola TaxID=3367746 RepID=UPI0038E4F5A1